VQGTRGLTVGPVWTPMCILVRVFGSSLGSNRAGHKTIAQRARNSWLLRTYRDLGGGQSLVSYCSLRLSASHGGSRRFESCCAHQLSLINQCITFLEQAGNAGNIKAFSKCCCQVTVAVRDAMRTDCRRLGTPPPPNHADRQTPGGTPVRPDTGMKVGHAPIT